MAGEWIRLRRGIRQNPKTVAMARHLSGDRGFMDWWAMPVQQHCRHAVTEIVTFANVTRVTACALAEFWGVLNDVVGDDCRVPYMTLQDIDDIVDVPGFGAAMEAVGWVVREDEKGLFFPNFLEHNAPQKTRPESKTPAQRAKEYRDRKRSGERVTARHGASHREEKSREENIEIHTHPARKASDEFRQPGWAGKEWESFVAVWNKTPKAAKWTPLTAPDGWVDAAASPGWLQKARLAVERLPRCRWFEKPVAVTQLIQAGWVDRILAGEFDNPRSKPSGRAGGRDFGDDKPPPKAFTGRDADAFEATRRALAAKTQEATR